MMVAGCWERAFVINLPTRTDRRREMEQELSRIGIHDPADAGVEFFDAVRPTELAGFPSIGAHGCFMSHLGVLRRAREMGLKHVAIFEDDLAFVPNFKTTLGPVRDRLSASNWHVFYGGYDLVGQPPQLRGPVDAVAPTMELRTTHFVCFAREAITRLVPFLEAMAARSAGDPAGGPMHVDGAYNWFRRQNPDLACYLAHPPLGVQRSSRSDIADLKWFDRMPVARQLVGVARRVLRKG